MNEFELSKNVQLDEYKVKDLNVDPTLGTRASFAPKKGHSRVPAAWL